MFINHCHIYPEGIAKFFMDSLGQGEDYLWYEKGTIPILKECMDKLNIEKAVVFALISELPMIDFNEWLRKRIKGDKSLYAFVAGVDPTKKGAAEKLKEYISLGFVGVKLHPAVQQFQVDDPAAEDFYSTAEELRTPLLFHTGVHGWYLEKYRPILFDKVAQNHPKLPIIIEHVGGLAFFYEALAVLQNNDNCYAGIAQIWTKDTPWQLAVEQKDLLIKTIGADRIIYGADFPWNNCEQIKFDIKAINSLNITSEEKEKILGKNIAGLIRSVKSSRTKDMS